MRIKTENTEVLNAYKKLADEKADGGDFLGALGLYYTLYDAAGGKDHNAIADIADCYADMGLLDISNRFWFEYLTVAPKDKKSVAYEELAINFFYMDNLWASGYYFHLKVETDGFIAEEGLDEEIIKFFSSSEIMKDAYYVAYPFDKANFEFRATGAKRAIGAGDYRLAIKHFRKIPIECMTEEMSGDYATALFLDNKDDELIEVCRDSIERHGENVTAYCALSSLYNARGDEDKADYYYRRALKIRKGERPECFKISACAIERRDDAVVDENVEKILQERPYDDVMNFFQGIARINLGDIAGAEKSFYNAYRIDPKDPVYKFYAELIAKAEKDNSCLDDLLPLKYAKKLPERLERAYRKELNAFLNGKKNEIYPELDETIENNRIFLYSDDVKTAKSAAFCLSAAGNIKSRKIMKDALLSEEVDDEVKSSIVYLLVVDGEKGQINAVSGNYFASIKPKKTVFERKADGTVFVSAYALVLTKAMFWGITDSAKLTYNMNGLYVSCKELINFNGFGVEHIACACYLASDFPRFSETGKVCEAFGIKKEDVPRMDEFVKFVKTIKPAYKTAAKKKADKKE